ncbi:DUF488 domain-containing protein [Alteribacillus sp. HJP-4]|uniref:DUF488 domain-containing protein n=1 Tax=Alteribacillus sp. HJP-4 TaxID=2775394 RepID=UPI0035CCCD97
MPIQTKRIYEKPAHNDGFRFLVDRVWPRGISKEKAALDDWVKEIAPSKELRQWFAHEKEKYPVFASRYKSEIIADKEAISIYNKMKKQARTETITLVFAAKEKRWNHAELLKKWLEEDKEIEQ